MTQVLRPTKPSEAAAIADMLAYHQNTKAAELFYTRAMRIKLSADEVKEQTGIQDKRKPDEIRAAWAVRLRMNLTEVLLDLQRPQEAHQLMSETEAIRQQYQLEPDLVRIGKLEAACKLHDYADKLKQEEPVCGQAPQYWKKRVEYYRGRQDTVQEEEALKRGLALTTPVDKASPEVYSNPRLEDHHCWFMREYLTFLERTKRTNAACALAYRMLATAPPESESACWAAYQVSEHLQLNPAYEEMLWRWLGAQPHLVGWTLERLLKAAPKDKQ
ncbi:MAG: hypothetical protein NTY53_01100 [Kiritimatiellaeota bacterium]|nr:hypothetical protein [Kiritimatiellota bacterium]